MPHALYLALAWHVAYRHTAFDRLPITAMRGYKMATYTAKLGQFQVTDRPDLGTIEGVQLFPSAEDVAIEFCGQLADALSGRQLADVVDRNNKETDPGICHSHDFCDANELMAAAFENLGVQTS